MNAARIAGEFIGKCKQENNILYRSQIYNMDQTYIPLDLAGIDFSLYFE